MRSMMKFAIGVVPALLLSTTAFAHSHTANGQLLANGQNHPLFVQDTDGSWDSCESYGAFPNSSIGAAWYGLETAHHGPDAATPGKGDGCYMIEGGLHPTNEASDRNPAIE